MLPSMLPPAPMFKACRLTLFLALLLTAGATHAAPHHRHSAPKTRIDYTTRAEVQAFIAAMVEQHDFSPDQLRRYFRHAGFEPGVIKAIQPPANPAIRSWIAYRGRFVEPGRIRAGLVFWDRHAADLQRAAAEYQVPAEIIAAIIGVETIYGRNTGKFETFSALTTLAFDYPPRAELFRRELEALLLLARDEQRSPLDYRGSYAGALGLPQFLPSSWREWAVDFDGDGHVDLNQPVDAIGSVAHFLAAHGWAPGGPILVDAEASGDGVEALLKEGIRPQRLPAEMEAFGVRPLAAAPALPAALIDYVTPDSPTTYRLGYQNFFVITRYNHSSFYATAVYELAQALVTAREGRSSE